MRSTCIASIVALSSLVGCSSEGPIDPAATHDILATASMLDATGDQVGEAILINKEGAISIELSVADLEPGESALHLHSIGECNAPDFTSAGGHLNPFEREHGSLNPQGQHLGDLPNLTVDEDGAGSTIFEFSGGTPELADLIFDEDGTAVMLHAGPDDYLSDPAGAAGPRVACGVLQKAN
ncbi:Superoxide dismutase [Altererythrobacter insulae]|nr:Superoxide dismutase [Altererythrobacter insulae]